MLQAAKIAGLTLAAQQGIRALTLTCSGHLSGFCCLTAEQRVSQVRASANFELSRPTDVLTSVTSLTPEQRMVLITSDVACRSADPVSMLSAQGPHTLRLLWRSPDIPAELDPILGPASVIRCDHTVANCTPKREGRALEPRGSFKFTGLPAAQRMHTWTAGCSAAWRPYQASSSMLTARYYAYQSRANRSLQRRGS